MPVIVFSSPKGGAGKTTAATILATELAHAGASVTVIDADPNRNVADWFKLPGAPAGLSVIADANEETIIDRIEEARAAAAFVIVDMEGTASVIVSYAIGLADLVIVPLQGSQLDARQAARAIKQVTSQERVVGRPIRHALLLTRTSPTLKPRTQQHIEKRLSELGLPVLQTRLIDREAYRAIFSFGGTLHGLTGKNVSNLATAVENARAFVSEVVGMVRSREAARDVA